MSKVEELRKLYPQVNKTIFNKFVEGDKTPTKKYLKFMLRTWVNKNHLIGSSAELVTLVNMFDELLPYIDNKDIYNQRYKSIQNFLDTINSAIDIKEEKTFIREEHVDVLIENDEYILLRPKTHKGSLKYGANTKWCTAGRKDENTFKRYTKNGFLTYLISKTNNKSSDYNKIAFHSNNAADSLIGDIDAFNQADKEVRMNRICENGWDVHDMFHIISTIRAHSTNWKLYSHAKNSLEEAVTILKDIDLDFLKKSMDVVERFENNDYIENVKKQINQFISNLPVKV